MPYIKQTERTNLDPLIESLSLRVVTVGQLNYVLSRLVARFLLNLRPVHYFDVNSVAGVLQKVAAEFDARVTRPYEDFKIQQNGDIPEYAEWDALIRDQKG